MSFTLYLLGSQQASLPAPWLPSMAPAFLFLAFYKDNDARHELSAGWLHVRAV